MPPEAVAVLDDRQEPAGQRNVMAKLALGTAFAAHFLLFPDTTSSNLPEPADPALRVSNSHIHPCMYG